MTCLPPQFGKLRRPERAKANQDTACRAEVEIGPVKGTSRSPKADTAEDGLGLSDAQPLKLLGGERLEPGGRDSKQRKIGVRFVPILPGHDHNLLCMDEKFQVFDWFCWLDGWRMGMEKDHFVRGASCYAGLEAIRPSSISCIGWIG